MPAASRPSIPETDSPAGLVVSDACSVFSYFDNRDTRHIFLEVEAQGILDADKLLERECGISAAKTPGVGCIPGKAFTFEPMTDEKADWIEGGGYNYFSQNVEVDSGPKALESHG
jgi:hypothetical protein